jgi:hypothetical protein
MDGFEKHNSGMMYHAIACEHARQNSDARIQHVTTPKLGLRAIAKSHAQNVSNTYTAVKYEGSTHCRKPHSVENRQTQC